MHRTPTKTTKPTVAKTRTAKAKPTAADQTTSSSPKPTTSASQWTPQSFVTLSKLARQKSDMIPPHKVLADKAKEQYDIIMESLTEATNLKKTLKDNINAAAFILFDMAETYNCDMTDHSREIVSIILSKIAEQEDMRQKTNEDIKEISNKLDKLIEQVTKQDIETKRKIEELSEVTNTNKTNNEQKLLDELKNQNTISKKTQQDILELKEQINIKPDTGKELLEELKKQNTIHEKTQQDLQDLKKEIKEVPRTQPIVNDKQAQTTSYAQVLKQDLKPKPTHCLIVGTDNGIDTSEEVITKIKTTINARNKGLQISKIRKIKDQRVLIGCEKQEDLDHIRERLEHHKFKVELKANKDPLVIIRNVIKSNTDDEILQSLEKQNAELLNHIPTEEYRMKVRHRRRARNPMENHIVLEVSPQVWSALTSAGRVYIDIQRVPVFDLSPLVQCSRCLAFGHGKKWCTESIDLCSHCSGPHLRMECPSLQAGEEPTCRNCLQAKLIKVDHNSFDVHCPVRKKWDDLARSSVAYS